MGFFSSASKRKPIRLAFILGVMVAFSGAARAQSQSAIREDLELSRFCSKAMRDFKNAPEWKAAAKESLSLSFSSHYNKRMGKCLVEVKSVDIVSSGGYLERDHVWDALENILLGGVTTFRKKMGSDEGAYVVMSRAGKIISDKQQAAETYAWFNTLMMD